MSEIDEEINYLINNVFLPPKLPQSSEGQEVPKNIARLLNELITAAKEYAENVDDPAEKTMFCQISKMLETNCYLQEGYGLSSEALVKELKTLGNGDIICLHINKQNAGLVIRHMGSECVFESFEVLPRSELVMSTNGRLLCSYPGPAIAVNTVKVQDDGFAGELALFLSMMHIQDLEQSKEYTTKAGQEQIEERESEKPILITSMLTELLRAIGRPYKEAKRIQKRVRDDCLWDKAFSPWRRSPLWLVIRVSIQTTISLSVGKDQGSYKSFMIFFVAKVLEVVHKSPTFVPDDVLRFMTTKIARRVSKAEHRIPNFVINKASKIITVISQYLKQRYDFIEKHMRSVLADPDIKSLNWEKDTNLSLENSKGYLLAIKTREEIEQKPKKFTPTEDPRLITDPLILPDLNKLPSHRPKLLLALSDFEGWVEHYLHDWFEKNCTDENSCSMLSNLTTEYGTRAKVAYDSSPENLSIMALTLIELWMVLDKMTIRHCSLLSSYPPEFSASLFEPLLLPKKSQMLRLQRFDLYLTKRLQKVESGYPSIFSCEYEKNMFAARSFDLSSEYRKIELEILEKAKAERDDKRKEYKEERCKYEALLDSAKNLSCEYNYYGNRYRHSWSCKKCDYNKKANELEIMVHEWPLPGDEDEPPKNLTTILRRKAVIFELNCPPAFNVWRDCTYNILVDIFTPKTVKTEKTETYGGLETSALLSEYYQNRERRLALNSTTKGFLASHYKSQPVSYPLYHFLKAHGQTFELVDILTSKLVAVQIGNSNIRDMCTLKLLAQGPYQNLQFSVKNTKHTSNEVIARQDECDNLLSLHEYVAFGELRAGHRIQWLNIARELGAKNLTFGNEAVVILLLQAAWQAEATDKGTGKGDDFRRAAHVDCGRREFSAALLRRIDTMLERVKDNWSERLFVDALVALASRLLSLRDRANGDGGANNGGVDNGGEVDSQADDGRADHDGVDGGVEDACRVLRKARNVAFKWTKQLLEKMSESKLDKDMERFKDRVVQTATICLSTFDVDAEDLKLVLSSAEDVRIAIQATIIIHDYSKVHHEQESTLIRSILDRSQRLRLASGLQSRLWELTEGDCSGIDKAIQDCWENYDTCLEHPWKKVPEGVGRWLERELIGDKVVHYDLISGELLINGQPLRRLPQEILTHPTYRRIFRETTFNVSPGTRTQSYCSQKKFQGYKLSFFTWKDELVIQAEKSVSQKFELIPHEKFRNDFPEHLVQNFVHWMNVETGTIEFRPLLELWEPSEKNWHICYTEPEISKMRIMHDGSVRKRLIDMKSETAKIYGDLLSPMLESREQIEIFVTEQSLFANLPRLKLEFFVNSKGQLECRQLRGMVVDEDQTLGTLTGLRNRLILKESVGGQQCKRKVLIPYGEVKYRLTEYGYVEAFINTKLLENVRYYVYDADILLRRLKGNGSLSSRLYKIYLHAITALPLPDKFTGRTGIEEALYDLQAAATWSFLQLGPDDLNLLNKIAALTPTRNYYPEHLTVMQTVSWDTQLPASTQHEDFYFIVNQIIQHDNRFRMFRPSANEDDGFVFDTNPELNTRAATRNAVYCNEESGASRALLRKDRFNEARDLTSHYPNLVYNIACKTEARSTNLYMGLDLMNFFKQWEVLKGYDPEIKLGYKRKWLDTKLSGHWCSLFVACKSLDLQKSGDRYKLIFTLCAMAFSGKVDENWLWMLLAFATVAGFKGFSMPLHSSYNLVMGFQPEKYTLRKCIEKHQIDFYPSTSGNAEIENFLRKTNQTIDYLVDSLTEQWPCIPSKPYRDKLPYAENFKLDGIEFEVEHLFENWRRNSEFQEFTKNVQGILNSLQPEYNAGNTETYSFTPCNTDKASATAKIVNWGSLLKLSAPCIPKPPALANKESPESPLELSGRFIPKRPALTKDKGSSESLEALISSFPGSTQAEIDYFSNLNESLSALNNPLVKYAEFEARCRPCKYAEFEARCRLCLEEAYTAILECLNNVSIESREKEMLNASGFWPRITPTTLLQRLALPFRVELNHDWKEALLDYAELITTLQSAERLYRLIGSNKPTSKELERETAGLIKKSWDRLAYPEWKLLEIENDILIRPAQAKTATSMILPPQGHGSVFQLNMGEGKSSVIVPLVAADLADGNKLVRVVVLKQLSPQMFRLLVQRLGGLLNRRVYYLPFSRSISLGKEGVEQIRIFLDECRKMHGILLTQPEHLLSFKLMGLEKLYNDNMEIATPLLEVQKWLDSKGRDILDESDEILHVKYQLVYTLGKPQPAEHSPTRWTVIQNIFDFVRSNANILKTDHPNGLEISTQGSSCGCFPIVRVLGDAAGRDILSKITRDISQDLLSELSFLSTHEDIKNRTIRLIEDENDHDDIGSTKWLDTHFDLSTRNTILLLKGLLSQRSGLLKTVLQDRRWRVDYGLYQQRTMYAVPYRGKDNPAPRAEFSHPDMAIILTCLSYYYGGLSDVQMNQCFDALLKMNNPVTIYGGWLKCNCDKTPCIPTAIATLQGINLDDTDQLALDVFPALRNRKLVIDFYLSQIVFPREAKEFAHKLSASGWDIAETRNFPTTGFSGTNDNSHLLPLSLKQIDLAWNKGTNAKVLLNLLLMENNNYACFKGEDQIESLLEMVVGQEPSIRVILDVGAQILWDNGKVAKKLLELTSQLEDAPEAAIYFDAYDELITLTRDGATEVLAFSQFATHLDQCIVYLDEVHTRGTDLKFPIECRAAVTLGPGLVKDRLAQACMRMRQLGRGHSVMFFAPAETDRKIREIRDHVPFDKNITSYDVLKYCIKETIQATKKNAFLWANQGLSYQERHSAAKRFNGGYIDNKAFAKELEEEEAQPLQDLYGRDHNVIRPTANASDPTRLEILEKCRYFGITELHSTRQHEEQEREIEQEAVRERQVERPLRATPAIHRVHPTLRRLVEKGDFSSVRLKESPFADAFKSLARTSAHKYNITGWSGSLLVTEDFSETIRLESSNDSQDDYLRPVNWIITLNVSKDPTLTLNGPKDSALTFSGSKSPTLIIISPYEVNCLLPAIRASEFVNLSVYSPRVTTDMQSFESLDLYATPSPKPFSAFPNLGIPALELHIFAGRLYLQNYEEYQTLCSFLGLYTGIPTDVISSDRFIAPGKRVQLNMALDCSSFESTPIMLLKSLTMLRRKGQDYMKTHIGSIVCAKVLKQDTLGFEKSTDGISSIQTKWLLCGCTVLIFTIAATFFITQYYFLTTTLP